MGIKLEADKDFADLMRRGQDAARAVGPAATKSICGNADLRSADASCIEHLIKIADRAKGRPVEYDKRRRGWFPVSEK
jgi:hypothetical protein